MSQWPGWDQCPPVNPPGPLVGLGHSLDPEGCEEALTVPRCPTNPFPWLPPMLGRLTPPGSGPRPSCREPLCKSDLQGWGCRRPLPLSVLRWRPGLSSHPWGQASRSRGITYQEVFKFLCFCDVDPAVLLHHLNVLHLVVEPGQRARASEVTMRATRATRAPAPRAPYTRRSKDPALGSHLPL